jgi:putative DNA primase/helicase
MNEMQQAARKLHALGFATLPIKPGTKEPATAHGVKDATHDDAITDAFYERNPNHGIGISGDGFVIFDFDVKDGVDGRDQLAGWKLPDTLCQTTPSGGYHMIYRTADEIRPSVNSEIAVDVRGWHSYIVCDPTPGYCFEDDCEVADADDAVIAFLNHVRPQKKKILPFKAQSGGNVKTKEGQGRNNELFAYGASLQSAARPDEEIEGLMYAYNKGHFEPPLDDAEFQKCVNSVLSTLPKGHSEEVKAQQRGRGRPRKFDHAKVAKQLIADNGACFVDGMPAIRNGKLYEIGWKAVSREIIRINEDATRANQKEVQHYLMVMAEQKRQSPPELIAFKNGVLDIRTMKLREYSDDDVIPNIIPHDWDADAECAEVDNVLLKMACGESDILESLMEVMGVCMYRSAEFTQSAILLGEGSNGKSTYIRMIQALLGTDNISSLDMAMLGKQFHTGQLAGKLANLGDDISNEFQRGDLLSVFKKVVDGNRVFTDVKGVEGFEFNPYATLVFSANEFPRLADYTDGMLRRIFPIEFNAKFSKTDADYDPRISRKITTKKACQRMAVLGVMGLHQVIENNGFTPNAASSRRVEEIKADNNTVLSWALENQWTTETLDGAVSITLYQEYKKWCDESGLQAVSRNKFSRQINKEYSMKSVDEWVSGATKKVFRVA